MDPRELDFDQIAEQMEIRPHGKVEPLTPDEWNVLVDVLIGKGWAHEGDLPPRKRCVSAIFIERLGGASFFRCRTEPGLHRHGYRYVARLLPTKEAEETT